MKENTPFPLDFFEYLGEMQEIIDYALKIREPVFPKLKKELLKLRHNFGPEVTIGEFLSSDARLNTAQREQLARFIGCKCRGKILDLAKTLRADRERP